MSEVVSPVQPTLKIALGIEYDGSRYYGWQRQQEVASVQQRLEQALSKVADAPISVLCAGRTDAGVHATGQVVHFETTARRYRYIIFNHRYRPAVLQQGVTHFYHPLDADRMHRAAQALLGENDFTSFRAVQCQSRTPWRCVKHVKVTRYGEYIVVDIKANAFVHHMVRNIVGSLMEIGCGNQDENWMAELLALKDRNLAAATARAEGLYLVAVDYPDHFGLPRPPMGPLFLPDD